MITTLGAEIAGKLGELTFAHPPGTFAPTPATLIALRAIVEHRELLSGQGLDWGSGVGCLAIAAARIPAVTHVLGLEIVAANVESAATNARMNGVAGKVEFIRSDAYEPFDDEGRARLAELEGRVRFMLANPPSSSPHGDGFEFRRVVLSGAGRWLEPGAPVFLSVSEQYGVERVKALEAEAPGFRFDGVLASTDLVAFDMTRTDLAQDVATYAAEERRGGLPYMFRDPSDPNRRMTAVEALERHARTGESPLSRWQSLRFTWKP
ncbi:MAG: class I SAM-dependent methyltransferase [Gemmatimonadetes bacterium]|nr:class I SAM-dependent methyltransferase [Gemmatimonadota bacterium]